MNIRIGFLSIRYEKFIISITILNFVIGQTNKKRQFYLDLYSIAKTVNVFNFR